MGLIDKYHVDSKYIIFEITENTYIHNVEAVNRMIQTFHQRGFPWMILILVILL